MFTSRTLCRVIRRLKCGRKSKATSFCIASQLINLPHLCVDVTLSSHHINVSKIRYQSTLATPVITSPRYHKALILWRHSSSDTTSESGNGDDVRGSGNGNGVGGGTTTTGGSDHEGKPVCPRCGEPFTESFTVISESVVK